MEKIVAVIDVSNRFAVSFTNFLNEKRAIPYRAMAFTELTAFLESMEEYEAELLVISEEFMEEKASLPDCPCIWLTEKNSDPEQDLVNRYHGADRLLKEILTRLSSVAYTGNQESAVTLTAFYSPIGGCGQTTTAIAYAAMRGRSCRTLYINLEECAGLSSLFPSRERDLSDAMYYYLASHAEGTDCKTKMLSCVDHYMDFDYISPTICGEDLAGLGPEDYLGFLSVLQDPTLYDEIVLDMGALIRKPWDILRNCMKIIIPIRCSCQMSQAKLSDFKEYLEKSQYCDLVPRLQMVEIPYMSQMVGQPITRELIERSDWVRTIKGGEP